jgi:hypothetical protein
MLDLHHCGKEELRVALSAKAGLTLARLMVRQD